MCAAAASASTSLTSSSALPSRSHSLAMCTVGLTVWFCVCLFFLLLLLVLVLFLPVCVLFFSGFKDFKNITKFIAPALTRIYFLLRPERIINLFFTRFFPSPSSSSFVCGVILAEGPQRPPYRPDSLSVMGFPSLCLSLPHTYQNYRIMQNAFKTKERKKDQSKSKQKKNEFK